MATIKSYTDISQSKTLSKILRHETADMFFADLLVEGKHKYLVHSLETYCFKTFKDTEVRKSNNLNFIPCWSLASLLCILQNYQLQTQDDGIGILCSRNGTINIATSDNSVDACYEMIIKLNELKVL